MPRVVLTSSSIAYSLLTLLQAQNKNFPTSPREWNMQMPLDSEEATNVAGSVIKFGTPNSNTSPTDVTSPDHSMSPGDYDRGADLLGLPLSEVFVKGSANNLVLYVRGA